VGNCFGPRAVLNFLGALLAIFSKISDQLLHCYSKFR
jgi:hypothetical protein